MLFTDESKFQLLRANRRQLLYHGDLYADNCVVEPVPYGGGGLIVWGSFTAHHRMQVMIIHGNLTGDRNQDEIVMQYIDPFMRTHKPGVILQPNNARFTQPMLSEQNVVVTSKFTCHGAVEYAFGELQRRFNHFHRPHTMLELELMLVQQWKNLPQAFLACVVGSMRRRSQACINANGRHTRYCL